MPKPIMMTGNLHNPVMKMPISCSVKDNTMDAAVERGSDAGCQLYLLGDERSLLPLVRGNQNERIDEIVPRLPALLLPIHGQPSVHDGCVPVVDQ